MENYRKSHVLAILIGILPLVFEVSSNIWNGDNGLFIISAAYGLILLLLALSIDVEDLDQWFLEKALSYLSVFLTLTAILNKVDLLPFAEIGALYQLAIIAYMGTLYFVDRHFNAKNLILLLLNLNILAQLSFRAGTLLILITSVLTFIFYLIRIAVTFSEELRPFLLCVYLIVLLISLIWYVPELPDFIFRNLSWSVGSIFLFLNLIIAVVYVKNRGHLIVNSHLILSNLVFLLVNEISLIVAESNVINTSYLVLIFILTLCLVNIFGNISLNREHRKISVLIPAHNSADTIVEALESIKNQTYRDWEIIIINDASTDETKNVIKRYLENNPLKVKYLYQKKHNYLNAIRYGMNDVTGDIIFVLNPDKILFDQNVFYRAISTLCGESCDGIFIGIRAMYQRLKDGKLHLIRPYYRNETSLVKTALNFGNNIYTNYAFWRREIFETSVCQNYLINGMPSWYNARDNLGLKVVNGNFIGLKYRVSNTTSNDFEQDKSNNLFRLSAQLRTLHHIASRIEIPFYKSQSILYHDFDKCHIASLCPLIFKWGQTPLKEITPLVIKDKLNNTNELYLNSIVDFGRNFSPKKMKEITVPNNIKIYDGAEIEEFNQKLLKNELSDFYYDLMEEIKNGTAIYKVKKEDKKKLEKVLELFTIKDYVKIVIS